MRNYIRLKDVLTRCACYIRVVEVDSLLMTDGIFVVQEFLMLDEITKSGGALLQDEKSEVSVEIQDLRCYWDKVRLLVLTDYTHSEQPVPVEGSTDMHTMHHVEICFVCIAEPGRTDSAEHLPESDFQPAGGCDRTSGSWKGQFTFSSSQSRSSRWTVCVFSSCLNLSICVWMSIQSSLLSSILGELPSEKGVLKVKGQLTYAAQQPWVFPGTVRSNILFGKEMNRQKYERVIKACALKRVRQFRCGCGFLTESTQHFSVGKMWSHVTVYTVHTALSTCV